MNNNIIENKNLILLEYLKEKFKIKYPDFKVLYLFGSRARGDYSQDSDFDLVAIFDSVDKDKDFKIFGIISEAEYKFDTLIDIQILTEEEFKFNPFFYEEVIKNGILYE
ncbi:MAG: nucleotidyltransferase domain-containing protein [Bacteroidetes bacterium]|nr:nucleotidyltransferase domain-containing protein [Bacteroidota bacterium]MBU2584355.1 nucleotidyltransferase domain-containing protein [Bacteroidota bacterium]